MDNNRKALIPLWFFCVLLAVILAVFGTAGSWRQKKRAEEEVSVEQEQKMASIESSLEAETAEKTVKLTDGQKQILNSLTEKFQEEDLESTARIISENEPVLEELFFDSLADKVFLYNGQTMTDQAEGEGLVFTRASTVFFGNFQDGKPEGQCTAIQVLHLEEGNRYDYSKGTWKKGKMNGQGECGYDYFDGLEGEGPETVIKQGTFSEDQLEGEIQYVNVGADGVWITWNMTVSKGQIVLDDRWSRTEDSQGRPVYQLMDSGGAGYAYQMEETSLGQGMWRNMIEFK